MSDRHSVILIDNVVYRIWSEFLGTFKLDSARLICTQARVNCTQDFEFPVKRLIPDAAMIQLERDHTTHFKTYYEILCIKAKGNEYIVDIMKLILSGIFFADSSTLASVVANTAKISKLFNVRPHSAIFPCTGSIFCFNDTSSNDYFSMLLEFIGKKIPSKRGSHNFEKVFKRHLTKYNFVEKTEKERQLR